jgi:hypothetical protein
MARSNGFRLGRLLGSNITIQADKIAEDAVGGSVTAYVNMAALVAVASPVSGDLALVQDLNKIFVHNGTGWFLIATVTNGSPNSITGVSSGYTLALDGTPIIITAISEDPEGFPLTWSYAVTTGSLGSTATVTQSNNIFTITPSANEADAGEFSITFSVTDNATGAVSVISEFVLTFLDYKWHFGTANIASGGFHCETTNSAEVSLDGLFTLESFIYFTDKRSGDYTFAITSTTGHGGFDNDVLIGLAPGGQWRWSAGISPITVAGTASPLVNTWYHVAMSKTATHTYCYVNGILDYTFVGNWGASQTTGVSSGVSIGHYYPIQVTNGTGYGFNGYISQCRMLTGTALYDGSNFTPPTSHPIIAGTTVALAYSNILEDKSPNPKTMLSAHGTLEASTTTY